MPCLRAGEGASCLVLSNWPRHLDIRRSGISNGMTENRKLENFGYMGVKGLLWWCIFFGPFLFFVFGSIPFLFLSFNEGYKKPGKSEWG